MSIPLTWNHTNRSSITQDTRETCNVKSSFCNADFYVVFENKSGLQCGYSLAVR